MSGRAGSRKRRREKSWPAILILLGIFVLIGLAAVFVHPRDNLAQMERVDRGDYASILWEDREYVPWSAGSGGRGGQLGYVDGDTKDKVYAFKGLPVEEWIINACDHEGSAMLYREKSVMDIPERLGKSEYPWNPQAG